MDNYSSSVEQLWRGSHSSDEDDRDKENTHGTPEKKKKKEDERKQKSWKIDRWLENSPTPISYVYPSYPSASYSEFIDLNERLWELRRYILVIKSETPPPADALCRLFRTRVVVLHRPNDTISKKNFSLISLLMTVMAIPPSTPPLNTSIAVGGGG